MKINILILKHDKKDTDSYLRLARYFVEKQEPYRARMIYLKALELRPDQQGIKNALKRVEEKIKSIEREEIIATLRDYTQAYNVGMEAKKQGNIKLAIAALECAMEFKATKYCITALAAAYRADKQLDKAEMLYNDVLSQEDCPIAKTGLAAVLRDKHQYAKAQKLYDEVLEETSTDPYALNGVGAVYSKKKMKQAAQECFEKVYDIENRNNI